MENVKKEEAEAKKIDRSSRYPSISLESAEKAIKEARAFGRNTSDALIAGKGSTKGGGFIRKRAALGYYGFLEGRGKRLRISDLAESLLFPRSEEERIKSLKSAFLTPELFSNLYKETQKNTLIDIDVLGNIVVRQHGITPAAKDEFISVFIKSGIYASLIQYGDGSKSSIIFLGDVLEGQTEEDAEVVQEDRKEEENTETQPSALIEALPDLGKEMQKFEIPFKDGTKAVIFTPPLHSLDKIKLKQIKGYITYLETSLVDNDAE